MNTELLAQLPSIWDQFSKVFWALGVIFHFSPYWGPPILAVTFWHMWLRYVRSSFIARQENILLEIRLPQEVMKSPAAMQAVFDGLHQKSGESSFIDRLWFGKVRVWYSFELVSLEGQVHLYVWVRKSFRKMVERSFYAHYPDAELTEVSDYSVLLDFSLETHDNFGADFKLAEPVGVPIRTYIDYKLDQTASKEEQKVDPLNHVFEFLGGMGKGEYVWIQLLVRANKPEDMTFGKIRNYKTYAQLASEEISRIRSNAEETIVFPDGGVGKVLSDKQIKRIQAINRTGTMSTHWDVGIRGIYIAEREHFDGTNISGLTTIFQPFGSPGFNSIVPDGSRWEPIFSYPWQDFNSIRVNKRKVEIIDAYRQRSWFHAPYEFQNFMMTSEELASLFHIPGSVARTPTMQRIGSARAEAPTNLPK
jgi:hypothetical protein